MCRSQLAPIVCTAFLSLAFLSNPASADEAQDRARSEHRLQAVRSTGPIEIDGKLDESAWAQAPLANKFVQSDPKEGDPASEETDVRVLYDDSSLYIGVFAHDRTPDGIITNQLKKDFTLTTGDIFEVVLDTYKDERNGYMFATNAAGAKWDAQMTGEGRETNADWDGIWNVKTQTTEAGWYAEMEIPFRTLRFVQQDPQSWGINFLRRIRRRNEDSYWAPLPRIYDLDRVSLAGTLEGMNGLRPGKDLRVKPYVSSSGSRIGAGSTDGDFDAGLDVKYGVAPGLTWDFTLNTDFSQVEADEQQINLTRFSLFFPEKREFFLENSGVFHFGQGQQRAGNGGGGRQNQVPTDIILFFSRRIGLSDAGTSIPIIGGTRLTGHVGKFGIGVVNIQQQKLDALRTTNFTAIRLRREILANSDIGIMMLNKDENGPRFNRVVGADANFRFFQKLDMNAYLAKSFSPGTLPGQGEDSSAQVGYDYRDRKWNFRGSFIAIGERFNDEMGYVPRVGINKTQVFFGRFIRPKATASWLREINAHWQINNVERRDGLGLDSRYFDYHGAFSFQNGGGGEVGANVSTEGLFAPFRINRRTGITIAPGLYDFTEWFVRLNTNAAAPLSFGGRYANGGFFDGDRQVYELNGTVRPSSRMAATVSLARNVIHLSGGDFNTNLVTTRVNYDFSTKMFVNALIQYNTDAQQWSSNIRFNIIHRPLSDFFLVYNDHRDSKTGDLQDRALIAKMTYMLAF